MHELSVARELLSAVERHAGGAFARVRSVRVSVGSASGVAPSALEYAFRALSADCALSAARLEIELVRARSRCFDCSAVFEFDGLIAACPGCGAFGGEILNGAELRLESIEVADV
jgi:hydrogenase nickel incorporation protein HypA/HybF